MSEESDDLDRLAQSIADGASINWDAIDKLPADARLKRLFSLLQMIDGVAEVDKQVPADALQGGGGGLDVFDEGGRRLGERDPRIEVEIGRAGHQVFDLVAEQPNRPRPAV